MRTSCDYCRRPRFKILEFDKDGYPLHPYHCNDCCKKCVRCNEFHIISYFHLVETEAVKMWRANGGLGVLNGRENFGDVCKKCEPFARQVDYTDDILKVLNGLS